MRLSEGFVGLQKNSGRTCFRSSLPKIHRLDFTRGCSPEIEKWRTCLENLTRFSWFLTWRAAFHDDTEDVRKRRGLKCRYLYSQIWLNFHIQPEIHQWKSGQNFCRWTLNKMQPDPILANLKVNPFMAYKTFLFRGRPWDLLKNLFLFFNWNIRNESYFKRWAKT